MGYKHRHPQNRAKAASLLVKLKGQLVDVTGVQVEALSNVYAAAEAYWQLSKASGVHFYQEGGGWHADLEFKGLPAGVPTIVGTPEPVPTREEAIESVVGMMSMCAQRDHVTPPDPATGLRWFRFDDHQVPVDPGMLEHFVSRVAVVDFDADHIPKELDLLRADISGDAPIMRRASSESDAAMELGWSFFLQAGGETDAPKVILEGEVEGLEADMVTQDGRYQSIPTLWRAMTDGAGFEVRTQPEDSE